MHRTDRVDGVKNKAKNEDWRGAQGRGEGRGGDREGTGESLLCV